MLGDFWSLRPVVWWLLLLLQAGLVITLIREYRLRRSIEARVRAILATTFTDLAVIDSSGVVADCNDNWARTHATANPFTAAYGRPWPSDAIEMPPHTRSE